MSPDDLAYLLIGVTAISALASAPLTTTTTGPEAAVVATTLLRLCTMGVWVWFAFESGYWQIAVAVVSTLAIVVSGNLARKASR